MNICGCKPCKLSWLSWASWAAPAEWKSWAEAAELKSWAEPAEPRQRNFENQKTNQRWSKSLYLHSRAPRTFPWQVEVWFWLFHDRLGWDLDVKQPKPHPSNDRLRCGLDVSNDRLGCGFGFSMTGWGVVLDFQGFPMTGWGVVLAVSWQKRSKPHLNLSIKSSKPHPNLSIQNLTLTPKP